MEVLFASGHAADIVLIVLVLEFAWLVWRGQGVIGAGLIVLPAILIVIGLRFALTDASWPWIAMPLALAFPVHLADLARRGARKP